MTLKEKIKQDVNEALKAKEELKASVLRLLVSAIQSRETDKRTKIWKQKPDMDSAKLEKESQLNEEEIIEVVSSEVKKRKESIAAYTQGGRKELADKEAAELVILKQYLPDEIPEEELRKLVKEAIEKSGAQSIKEMGKIMGILMPKVKGRADGGSISQIVKEFLK